MPLRWFAQVRFRCKLKVSAALVKKENFCRISSHSASNELNAYEETKFRRPVRSAAFCRVRQPHAAAADTKSQLIQIQTQLQLMQDNMARMQTIV